VGDIYAKMASIAYDKALSLDSKNATAQTKLALIKDMIGANPASKPVNSKAPVAAPALTAKPASKPTAEAKLPSPDKPVPVSAAAASIETAIANWAQAWSKRDVDAYLAAYASDFAASGMTRASWEAQRRSRIASPKQIDVQISELKIEQQGDTASATFRQAYRSDLLTSTVTKTLKLALQNGQWRIVSEASQ
jgi:ketosteroid isomerase-like protein